MYKEINTRYAYKCWQEADGIHTSLVHLENHREQKFFTANGQGNLEGHCSHMESLTDELCDFWLDPERQEIAKKAAKEEAKLQRQRNMEQAAQEKADKQKKKEENRRKQLEAIQRQQEANSN